MNKYMIGLVAAGLAGLGTMSLALDGSALAAADQVQAELAWPEFDGDRSEIFYNQYRHGQWQGKTQVTSNEYNNLHPEMAVVDDNTVWMVWTALNGLNNKLFYAVQSEGKWGYPQEIETGLQSSIGPTIALDGDGVPWIAWAGYNGVADDVYVSHWTGTEWSKPQQVNPANEVPDILPKISLNSENRLAVVWQAYDGEAYRYYASELAEGAWSQPAVLLTEPEEEASASEKLAKEKIPMPSDFSPIEQGEDIYKLLVR